MSGNDKVLTAKTLGRNTVPVAMICLGAALLALSPRRHRQADPRPAGYFDIYEGFDSDEDGRARLAARMAVARARLSGAFDAAKGQAEAVARAVRASSYHRSIRKKLGAAVEVETAAAVGVGLVVGLAIGIGVMAGTRRRG
jgi:hypothetical protein